MKLQPVGADLLPKVVKAMGQCAIFKGLDERALMPVAQQAVLVHCTPGEVLARQGDAADTITILLSGQARMSHAPPGGSDRFDVGLLRPMESFGEIDLFLGQSFAVSLIASNAVLALRLTRQVVEMVFERAPSWGPIIGRLLAGRVRRAESAVPLPHHDLARSPPSDDVFKLLPLEFIQRQRVMPIASQGSNLTVGFVDELTVRAMQAVQTNCPGMAIQPVRIGAEPFNKIMQSRGPSFDLTSAVPRPAVGGMRPPIAPTTSSGAAQATAASGPSRPVQADGTIVRQFGPRQPGNPKLDALLRRMVAEGASDLHLSAAHKPRWRIDGEILEIREARVLGAEAVYELFEPVMADRSIRDFQNNDADFAYAVEGVARFRVNLFRDRGGACAVLRQIPDKILTFEQLGLPESVRKMCDHPKGLVLVTGPTGSGKSTTLAAMIDYINRSRRTHIITLEDPIEFVHKSRKALVNQREVVEHTASFARALKSALREDPDIVLVGEMRDIETVALALETANTGHLVFGTLHTATAISTVDRLIDLFPHEQQSQIRAVTAEVLKGVISQTLLRKKGGGRLAALEIMVGSGAISNLIREAKNHQIANIMMTAKKMGNTMLNEQLQKLVMDDKVDYEEALSKAIDKVDMAKRFGREYFDS